MLFSALSTTEMYLRLSITDFILKWIHYSSTSFYICPISWYFPINMLWCKTKRTMITACLFRYWNLFSTSYTQKCFINFFHSVIICIIIFFPNKKNPKRRGNKALYPHKSKWWLSVAQMAYTCSASWRTRWEGEKRSHKRLRLYDALILSFFIFSREEIDNPLTSS